MAGSEKKRCNICGLEKHLDDFYMHPTCIDGHLGRCKACILAQRRTPEWRKQRQAKRMPERDVWDNIIQRCTNPKNPNYKYYGDRGISICPAWRESFDVFLRDVGKRPSPELTLERVNNDGNYEPGNCIWDTFENQQFNRRRSRPPLTQCKNGHTLTPENQRCRICRLAWRKAYRKKQKEQS